MNKLVEGNENLFVPFRASTNLQGRTKPRKADLRIKFRLLTFKFVVISHGKRDLSSLPEAAVQIS